MVIQPLSLSLSLPPCTLPRNDHVQCLIAPVMLSFTNVFLPTVLFFYGHWCLHPSATIRCQLSLPPAFVSSMLSSGHHFSMMSSNHWRNHIFQPCNRPLVASATILQLHWPSSSPYLLLTIVIHYCQHLSPAFHFTSSPIHSIFDLILPTLLHKNTLFPNLRSTQDSNLSLREMLETFF